MASTLTGCPVEPSLRDPTRCVPKTHESANTGARIRSSARKKRPTSESRAADSSQRQTPRPPRYESEPLTTVMEASP